LQKLHAAHNSIPHFSQISIVVFCLNEQGL